MKIRSLGVALKLSERSALSLAVTYLNDKAKKYVEPLARELEAGIMMPLDVREPGQMEAVFERIAKEWRKLDFVVHSIAFSPKDALQGRVVDVSREGFLSPPWTCRAGLSFAWRTWRRR
jgi:enoyl-[acyl-carrier-protein] reductase (NADH)